MKIFVKAEPDAKKEKIIQTDETHFTVAVREPPVRGLANKAIVKALAAHFGVIESQVRIISGYTSRNKIVEITVLQ